MELTSEELNTVLQALRYYQRDGAPILDYSFDEPLSVDDIDDLCEKINTA